MPEVLGRKALNRALLARQLLLRRERRSVADVVAHLVGMQAQAPQPPYLGLCGRIEGFDPAEASTLLAERRLVRATAMRGTIHLLTAEDYLAIRPLLQDQLERGLHASQWGPAVAALDLPALLAKGRELLTERPSTPAELGERLAEHWPGVEPRAMATAVQWLTPLVQLPPRGLWGRAGQPVNTTAEAWLGRPCDPEPSARGLVLRYLAAFGPATVRDVQAWCGLTRLGEVVDGLRPELCTFADERGRELFDLPDAPRPDPATPAPARLLAPFDNILLGHADRERIISEPDRARVFTVNGIVRGSVLVNGFVRGTWRHSVRRDEAGVDVEAFRRLSTKDTKAVQREARRLLAMLAPDAKSHRVDISHPNGS